MWECDACGEKHDDQLELCWKCQGYRDSVVEEQNQEIELTPKQNSNTYDEVSSKKVQITNLDIPFWDLTYFMVKFAIALIPASLILFCIFFLLSMLWTAVLIHI